ncbi:polyamine aminopropyltransferase [Solwaraspora sp. WMMB335]|uniref:polyamine aminopropyltransferase n=1 Tax=Solwaraspora sp. WMMB335 TaxID=3404118 RepID=UPI003B92557D
MTTVAAPPAYAGSARPAVLAAVFVCAACGLVYELALVALGSYLIGDTVGQASIVLGVMVFAMGVGALAAKPLQARAVVAFAAVELTLALLGGLSVLGLYAAFAWLNLYAPALVATAFVLGLLIGAEIPLLMVLLQRIRAQPAGSAVADLFAADYVGALLGGLTFPFLLIPLFGQLRGALVVGAVNALAGVLLVGVVFRRDLGIRARATVGTAAIVVGALLAGAYLVAEDFEVTARQQLYRDPVVYAEHSRYQEIVLTRAVSTVSGGADIRLYLNGDLQFSSVDEYRYHEALVHPALAGRRDRVLVLGGGDGLALREVLRYPDVTAVTLVELDPAVVALARDDTTLRELNGDAFGDPRVRVVLADAFTWLRSAPPGAFDAVIVDMPDPDQTSTAKLYSVEFYGLVRAVLAPHGRMAVQAGSPYFAQRAYWCVEASIREAGYATRPYHVDVPSFGDWGFLLASASASASASDGAGSRPPLLVPADAPPLRFLHPQVLRAAEVFAPDRGRVPVAASTLLEPRVLDYTRQGWRDY